jgi:hypothetical protein
MEREIAYTPRERAALWTLAAVGGLGVNGLFVHGLLARPGAMAGALGNPIALAFVLEAFVLLGMLAYLLPRWGVSRRSRFAFVALSLLGGIVFALPVVLLWRRRG